MLSLNPAHRSGGLLYLKGERMTTVSIIMKGKQHVIGVDKGKFPVESSIEFPVEIDKEGRQIIFLCKREKPLKFYTLCTTKNTRKGKVYEYGQIGLHPEFLARNGLGKGDSVNVDYRKDRVVISKAMNEVDREVEARR